jgi:hypothetical protein
VVDQSDVHCNWQEANLREVEGDVDEADEDAGAVADAGIAR